MKRVKVEGALGVGKTLDIEVLLIFLFKQQSTMKLRYTNYA